MRYMPEHDEPLESQEPDTPSSRSHRTPPSSAPASGPHNCVELRVHGVSGGQAEELLDVEPAMKVGGDRLAGFFRWRREADTETVPGVRREIFAWGNLTSGSASRAFWLLLLPFMLVNVAYWMRPGRMDREPRGIRRLANNVYGAAVRLLALSLTVLIVLAAAGIGMDLVAWQCSAQGVRCVEARTLSAYLPSTGSALSTPGVVLLVGAVLPVAVILVLWWLSRRTSADYEVVTRTSGRGEAEDAAPLSRPDFWSNGETMARLRSAHIAVAVATVTALLLMPALLFDLAAHGKAETVIPGSRTPGIVLAVLLAGTTASSALSVLIPAVASRWNALADRLCSLLRNLSLCLAPVVAVYALWPRPGWEIEGPLPGGAALLNTLFAVQGALITALFLAAWVLYATDRAHERTAMRGHAGPVMATIGALLGGAFSAALVHQGSLWLSDCGSVTGARSGCLPPAPPEIYSWLQLTIALEAVVLLMAAAVWALRVRSETRAQVPEVTSLYSRSARDRRTWDIARSWALGRTTEMLPAVLSALMIPVAAMAVLTVHAMLTGALEAGPSPAADAVAGGLQGLAQGAVSGLIRLGSLLSGLALVVLAWIGRSAYRDRPTRNAVGVLWDIGTFWPRVAHPLAPPSYAERAVPQLTARVAHMAGEDTKVVLSGHSQGSVLAAATVWQLPTDCRDRVLLLTHGSPLDRLYSRYFPAYFGPEPFADLRRRVKEWCNLWRSSDAIAGQVYMRDDSAPDGLLPVDPGHPLPDPSSYDAPPGEARRPKVMGHSYYTYDPAYAESLWTVLFAENIDKHGERKTAAPAGSRQEELPGPIRTVVAPVTGTLDRRSHVEKVDEDHDQAHDDEHASAGEHRDP